VIEIIGNIDIEIDIAEALFGLLTYFIIVRSVVNDVMFVNAIS